MTDVEADALLAPAVPAGPGVWADLGAGAGILTRALARRLGAGGTVWAVDHDAPALRSIPEADGAAIHTLVGDVRDPAGLPTRLDGALCANVLHFVPEAESVLASLAQRLALGGRVVIFEYDRERGSRYVPFPISRRRLGAVAEAAGLVPEMVGTWPSRFGGDLYVAVLRLGAG